MGDYRTLVVWQKAHQLTLSVYDATAEFPASELYGLTSQTRRAAASIAMNLAEGCGRNSDRELAHYCRISLGSTNELDYQLLLARDLGLVDTSSYEALSQSTGEIKRMLAALAARLAH